MPAKTPADPFPVVELEDLLARSGVRDRASIEKHLALLDGEPDARHAKLWRRLAKTLGTYAPLPVHTGGPQVVLFFVADGKYRMQVFAMEDRRDGVILIYIPDIMTQAVREKIVIKNGTQYTVGGARGPTLMIHAMDADNTTDPPAHVKHMIGWNRKAIRITLDANETDSPQVTAAEALCGVAAKKWASMAASTQA